MLHVTQIVYNIPMIKIVINGLATLTLLTDIFITAVVFLFILKKLTKRNYLTQVKKLISPQSYHFSLLVSLAATLGSLFFSEVAKFSPCILCWYQRIFMYPQPLLLYLGILRNEKVITPYLLLMNIIGALIASYHYLIQLLPKMSILNCEVGGAISCTKKFTLYYGYITIPMMALSAFLLNILLLKWTITKSKTSSK